jgi:rhamnosyltransferase
MGIGTMPPIATAPRICAVIVTYHPDPGLIDRVPRVAKQVSQTLIVDNGSPACCVEQLRKMAKQYDVHLILNPRNEGIAQALNTAARWAMENGYLWLLTLDQDTAVSPDMIETFEGVLCRDSCPQRLAVIGSNYVHKENKRLFWDRFGSDGALSAEMTTVLTSGSLISLAVFREIGGFRDDFFVDCVDHEYCLRARAHGFRVIVTSKPVMEHGIGRLTEHRLLWRKVGTSNHAPIRHYFMTRNTLILTAEYMDKEPRWVLWHLFGWAKSVARVCLFENQRIGKMKSIWRGCVDGILRRTPSDFGIAGRQDRPFAGRTLQ